MTAPATTDAFLELVRKSGMVDAEKLTAFLGALGADAPPPRKVHRLARRMIADGLLTNFQAEQLLRGKWRGFTIGNYRIVERIAHGGMGTVYLAEHARMPRRFAIKVLPGELAKSPLVVERFYREARASAALDHPNLVRATDVDCAGGVHYLVMEYVDGVNLQDLVDRRGPLAVDRAANYIAQAACGLQFAHEVAGLVHRDIKPANLMLDRTGTVRILDMGLARMYVAGFFNAQTDNITKNHNDQSILGTADYIAPEQALDSQAADLRADVYSLGGTFYFLLTGRPPFPGGSVTQKLMAHQLKAADPLRSLRPDVPEALAAVVDGLMAKDPARRPQAHAAVIEALRPWLTADVVPPSGEEVPPLCAAAQGPGTGASSGALSGRLARPSADGSGALSGRVARPGADTSGSLPRSETQATPPAPAPAPPPVAPSDLLRQRARRWVAVAAAVIAAFRRGVARWLRPVPGAGNADKPNPEHRAC